MSGAPRVRGVIEGFFGAPYTFEQRRELIRFLPEAGLNTYIYAPKNDPFHRDEWRTPYPPEYLEHFRDLVALGDEIGVAFIFALAPGLSYEPSGDDPERLRTKLASILDTGVRDACVFFDDINGDAPAARPAVQAELVAMTAGFLRARNPRSTLCFISSYYAGTADELASDGSVFARLFPTPSSAYYAAYAGVPADVPIMWTGPAVFSEYLTVAEAADFRAFVKRPVWVWDNYPVNDALVANELYLAPYEGRAAGLATELDGVLLNPMLQAEATKIPLWTAGRSFSEGDAYDPWRAWEEALAVASNGRGTAPLRFLARHFLSHPLIGSSEESPELAAAITGFWDERSRDAEQRLRALFETCARNRAELEATLGNPALLAEVLEPATKLSLFGEAGLLALDLLAAKTSGAAVDLGVLQGRLDAAARIPWLVGANTMIPRGVATLIGRREPRRADVFGDFFTRVRTELGA